MASSSRLNSIHATAHAPAKMRGEIRAKQQPAFLTEATRATLLGERGVVKMVALDTGISEERLYALADPTKPPTLKAGEIAAIVSATRNYGILDAIESEVGRRALRLPEVHVDERAQVLGHTTAVVREFGDALTHVSASIADGTISLAEQKQIDKEIDEAFRSLAELQAVIRARVELPARADRMAKVDDPRAPAADQHTRKRA